MHMSSPSLLLLPLRPSPLHLMQEPAFSTWLCCTSTCSSPSLQCFLNNLLDGGQRTYPTIQVRNQCAEQPHNPPRVTGQHMDAQRSLSKDPSHLLAACFGDRCSMPQSQSLLCRPQEGFNYIWLQLCKTTGQRASETQHTGNHEATASGTCWSVAASWIM